jgi:hypothetical protein
VELNESLWRKNRFTIDQEYDTHHIEKSGMESDVHHIEKSGMASEDSDATGTSRRMGRDATISLTVYLISRTLKTSFNLSTFLSLQMLGVNCSYLNRVSKKFRIV